MINRLERLDSGIGVSSPDQLKPEHALICKPPIRYSDYQLPMYVWQVSRALSPAGRFDL